MDQTEYIFNASFYTTPDYFRQWEEWLHAELFPVVNEKMPGIETEVFQVQSDINGDMLVFSVQFRCSSAENLAAIKSLTIPVFNGFREKFGERVTNFNSVLKKIT